MEGRAVPEVLAMSGAVKIFTSNTALRDMSSGHGEQNGGEGESCDALPSGAFRLSRPSAVASFFFASSPQIKWVSITHQCNALEGRKGRI